MADIAAWTQLIFAPSSAPAAAAAHATCAGRVRLSAPSSLDMGRPEHRWAARGGARGAGLGRTASRPRSPVPDPNPSLGKGGTGGARLRRRRRRQRDGPRGSSHRPGPPPGAHRRRRARPWQPCARGRRRSWGRAQRPLRPPRTRPGHPWAGRGARRGEADPPASRARSPAPPSLCLSPSIRRDEGRGMRLTEKADAMAALSSLVTPHACAAARCPPPLSPSQV